MLKKDIETNYPFISIIFYGGKEYVGIVVNQDQYVTTILNYAFLKTINDKKLFLELGNIWWMESNRLIPITIFLREDIESLKYSLMTMNTKDVKVLFGPVINMQEIVVKRIKRKNIQLVRHIKSKS